MNLSPGSLDHFSPSIAGRKAPLVDGIAAAARSKKLARQIVARIEEHSMLVARTLVHEVWGRFP